MGKKFSAVIGRWYDHNMRDLPWRNFADPYTIWLSEILLQQTRVDQGLPYFLKFKETFPSVDDLAEASLDRVLKLWQGLGYYSRARNMHATAQYISHTLDGKFPNNYKDLLRLKGVGEYTAAAVASIAFNEALPVVDGNVIRVISRYFGLEEAVDSAAGMKSIKEICARELDQIKPGKHNQALMEFGSLQCKPKNPACDECPLKGTCFAYQKDLVDSLPWKERRTKVKTVFYHFMVIKQGEEICLEQRPARGIWNSMYQFPLFETEKEKFVLDSGNLSDILLEMGLKLEGGVIEGVHKATHLLSHRKIVASFWEISCKKVQIHPNSAIFVIAKNRIQQEYAVPRLIEKYISSKS